MPTDQHEDLARIERKVDKLSETIGKLVLIEERQTTQLGRIGDVERRLTVLETTQVVTDKKVDMWINRGIGGWALAATLFGLYQAFKLS